MLNNGEALSSRNTQTKNFLSPQHESNQWPSTPLVECSNYWANNGRLVMSKVRYKVLACETSVLPYCKAQHVEMIRASNHWLDDQGFDSCWVFRKFFFWVFRLRSASPLFTRYPSHQSINWILMLFCKNF